MECSRSPSSNAPSMRTIPLSVQFRFRDRSIKSVVRRLTREAPHLPVADLHQGIGPLGG